MPSRIICFVCGSVGAELTIHIKPRDKGPYFPFLEHHDPPKGSRLPGPDGLVDSCRVCFAFLTQQWEAYERNKTPAIKRLYWLKRADNGHFTGAEMKLQGEYMAQVMGLQYQTSNDSYNPSSPDRPSYTRDGYLIQGSNQHQPDQTRNRPVQQAADGALDLSVGPPKVTVDHNRSNQAHRQVVRDCFTCFTCGKEKSASGCKLVSAMRQEGNDPYFPFLEKISVPKGAMPISNQGLVQTCEQCFTSLFQQWIAYERAGAPVSARMFTVGEDVPSKPQIREPSIRDSYEKEKGSDLETCYLCGQSYPIKAIRPLYTGPSSDNKLVMYFQFIRELRRPHGARPLNPDGTVLVCQNCHHNLQNQWCHYEAKKIPLIQRRYSLLPVSGPSYSMPQQLTERPLQAKEPDKPHPKPPSDGSDVTQPLNIHISKSPLPSAVQTTSQGLLAIAQPVVKTETFEPNTSSCSPSLTSSSVNNALAARVLEHHRQLSETKPSSSGASIPHPLQQATSIPKKVCFICGEKCLINKARTLCSYPVRHEAKGPNSQSPPFFPFLASKDPATGAEPMTEDGTVIACSYCCCSLNTQWKDFEESKDPEDHKRWVRKYFVADFTCYVCGTSVPRRSIRTLEVHKFPFLKDHKAPPNALVFGHGEEIAACLSCATSLRHQFSEYERMGVPDDHRKYNWMQQPNPVHVFEENSCDSRDQDISEARGFAQMVSYDDDSNVSQPETYRQGEGVAAGSKPPPLNMLSPAASSKVSRNTATVPPLNQVSPSNGLNSISGDAALSATRTSSFAAALRKLAHQAKDPIDEPASNSKHNSPPSSNVSPRSSTPKRAPPPLVYASQASSLTSPPVVTIAPTQAHPAVLNSDTRQGLERVSSAHSTTSSVYEPLALKQERDQRPLSSHSRDDDRSSIKDGPHGQTPSRILTPHSTPGSTQRDDGLVRGFQPYRPGDEIRPPVPPPFGMDAAAYQAAYHPAFMAPHPYSHPAYRFEDPMMLERYRMMQPPYLPFTTAAGGMIPHPGMHHLIPGSRYPAELLNQYPYLSPSPAGIGPRSPALSAERVRAEEDRQREIDREREREREREKEREREREREREKEREREAEIQRLKEQQREMERAKQKILERRNDLTNSHNSVLSVPHRGRYHDDHRGHESGVKASKFGSITQGTPRDPGNRASGDNGYRREDMRWSDGMRGEHERNHYMQKHSESHHSRHNNSASVEGHRRLDMETSRNHQSSDRGQPPPLVSPRQGETIRNGRSSDGGAIFRPFEKPVHDSPYLHSSKSTDLSVPSYRHAHNREGTNDTRDRHHESGNHRDTSDTYDRHQLKKTISMTQSNHNIEKFDFRSLATEFGHKIDTQSVDSRLAMPFSDKNFSQRLPLDNHVRSKLDIEEQKLRESRLNGTYCSDTEDDCPSDEEERKIQKLLLISQGPPLRFDPSQQKKRLFNELGLVSYRKKKDILFEKLRKRRKFHREQSVSPVQLEEENCSPLPTPSLSDSELLCQEPEFPQKCQFLKFIDLSPLAKEKRRELDQIRRVCQQEKERRLGILEETNRRLNHMRAFDLPETAGCGLKRKFDEMENMSTRCEPVKISLGQLQARHQKQAKNSNHVKSSALLFPEAGDRQLSREFAEQFHESVLQTTRQKEIANRLGTSGCRSEESYSSQSADQSNAPSQLRFSVSGDSSSIGRHGNTDSSDYGTNPGLRWPGIETVIDSYQRYLEEQRLERQVLSERCRHLRSDNIDLNRTAERLSHRVSSLLDAKQRVEEDRNQSQSAIDNIKRCLKYLR